MPVKNYCRLAPCTASPGESIEEAAVRMDARGIGSLVVVDANELSGAAELIRSQFPADLGADSLDRIQRGIDAMRRRLRGSS